MWEERAAAVREGVGRGAPSSPPSERAGAHNALGRAPGPRRHGLEGLRALRHDRGPGENKHKGLVSKRRLWATGPPVPHALPALNPNPPHDHIVGGGGFSSVPDPNPRDVGKGGVV